MNTADTALIPTDEFIGLDDVVHLSAGGESPALKTHTNATSRFFSDKALGERARALQAELVESTRAQCAKLWSVPAKDLTFVSSASEGINIVTYGLDWQPGDNVVIADVEFASGVYPWTRLQSLGVEVRIARHRNWYIDLDAVETLIDERTRVVVMSQVSMFTGQRIDVRALAERVHRYNALLLLDATHAAGVVPVNAAAADIVVSSCYKWLLGVHGTALFYWNRERLPDLSPPFLGWNSAASSGGWEQPTQLTLHDSAHRFMPGNPSFLSLYLLNNALDRLLPIGMDNIEQHALQLTDLLWQGAAEQGWEMMTPAAREERAGNVCIMSDRVDAVAAALRKHNILVWGTYAGDARLRISTHVYNTTDDVKACLSALATVKPA